LVSLVPSTVEQWLAYQAQVHPRAIDLSLERLTEVLARLQWRRPQLPVITVAGTNGKGSVVAICASILAAAGCKVGTFTSPHLRDYRERIRVADRNVEDAQLIAAFERIERARGGIGLTFFEYNTLAALLILEAARLDAWILEVGMGGRLDAVNVVDPDVAVVVSIGFDHMEFLGRSLDEIAREKAGIFRPGRAAVIGSRDPPSVLEATATSLGAPLKRLGLEFDYSRSARSWHYRGPRWDLPGLPPPALRGDKQYENAATAIAALEELRLPAPVSAFAVAQGLIDVRLVGRFQVIRGDETAGADARRPTWILDVAHNPAAARVLAGNLRSLPVQGRTLAICGILGDKDAGGIIEELADGIDAWYFVSTDGERGSTGESLAARFGRRVAGPDAGSQAAAYESIPAACEAALAAAHPIDRIVVFGSFHTVGPALDWLEARGL
jgi:dihydrofolate synthase / folylpolyglutamate synthase